MKRLKETFQQKMDAIKKKSSFTKPQTPSSFQSIRHKRSFSSKDEKIDVKLQDEIRKAYTNIGKNIYIALKHNMDINLTPKNKQYDEFGDDLLKMIGEYTETLISLFKYRF